MRCFFKVAFAIIACFLVVTTYAQSSNFKAQGYYYKAKDYYQSGQYSSAVEYAKKSRESLGGSNEVLQYLFIMSYVRQNNWVKAETEMQLYFDLLDNKAEDVSYSKTVDDLTADETKELTKLMIDIEENAVGQRCRCNACDGSGKTSYSSERVTKCYTCGGDGQIEVRHSDCNGTGTVGYWSMGYYMTYKCICKDGKTSGSCTESRCHYVETPDDEYSSGVHGWTDTKYGDRSCTKCGGDGCID